MSDKMFEQFEQTGQLAIEASTKSAEAIERGVSRVQFLRRTALAGGALAAGAGVLGILNPLTARAAQLGPMRGAAGVTCSCTTQDIVNIASTAELLAITMYFNALQLPTQLPQVNDIANHNYFQAALTEEYLHYEILLSLGAKPLATKFYFPADMFTHLYRFLATLDTLETAFIGAYLAAAQEFSGVVSSGITHANPTLIGAAVQIAGVESEHRALGRVVGGQNPPNNLYLEAAPFTCVTQAATALSPFLAGGSGFVGPYSVPSKNEVDNRAIPYGFGFFDKEPIA